MENQFEIQRSLGRIEGGILELKADVTLIRTDHALLRAEFTKLEAGRLTKLESQFAVAQSEIHTKARQTAIWTSSAVAIIISITTAIIIHFLKI